MSVFGALEATRGRLGAMAYTAHEDAVQRLEAGLLDQDRCSERYDAAIGTSSEVSAYTRLRAAGARVAAHETWLHWVDDEGFRGLNAGPFERLAETREAGPASRLKGRGRR